MEAAVDLDSLISGVTLFTLDETSSGPLVLLTRMSQSEAPKHWLDMDNISVAMFYRLLYKDAKLLGSAENGCGEPQTVKYLFGCYVR